MSAPTAPVTQDVVTIPRRDAGRPNLIGLTRDQLREALAGIGIPERQLKMRAGQIWQWLYHWGIHDFDAMTNLSKDVPRQRCSGTRFTIETARTGLSATQRGRHPQISGPHRRRARGRNGVYP